MKNSKTIYFFFCCLFLISTLKAQTGSPFSDYGVGTLQSHNMVQNESMGGAGIGYFSHTSINFNNPASYSELRLVNIDVGVSSYNGIVKDKENKQKYYLGNFNHFNLSSPICKWMDLSLGVMPFSTVNYGYSTSAQDNSLGNITYENKGTGGLSNGYLGTGFKIKIDSNSSIALGANASYLFGKINRDYRAIYEATGAFNTLNQTSNYAGGFYFNYGLLYRKQITVYSQKDSVGNYLKRKKLNFSLGISFAPATSISNKYNQLLETYTGDVGFETFKDTLINKTSKNKLKIPQMLGIGIMISDPSNKWLFAADYQMNEWSKTNVSSEEKMIDENVVRAGMQICPNPISTKYWNTVKYRFGAKYQTGYLSINNNPLTQYGVTFGFGFPIRINQHGAYSISSINLGFEVGKEGDINKNMLTQYYGNIHLSLTINDKWYYKYKYD